MTQTIDELKEQCEQARLENEMACLKAETAAINGVNFPGMYIAEAERPNENLQEAWGDLVPRNEYPSGNWDGMNNPRASGLWNTIGAQLGDRSYGQDEQVFQNEIEHARIRAIGRLLCNVSVNAKAVQANLVAYILGTGFSYKVVPEEGEKENAELIKAVQAIIKKVQADNKWWKRERQWFRRSRRDGEYFVALYHVGGGRVQLRTIEPEQISEPDDVEQVVRYFGLPDRPWSWKFGIATDDDDTEAVHGYAVKWRTAEGRDTLNYFPESQIVHCKLNVDENIKRGVSDYYAVYEQLIDAGKLLRNTAKGHAIMSAIAFIREHAPGVSQTQAESMRTTKSWNRYNEPMPTGGTRTRFTQKFDPGTILDVPKGQVYKAPPMAGQGVGKAAIEVEEAVLRIAGSNWCMPPFMISGNMGEAAYAAVLVAESPWVKFCEGEQIDHGEEYVEILWKAIHIAYAAGRFDGRRVRSFEDIKRQVKIQVEKPIVASRDKNVETNRHKILRDSGIIADETWAAEEGYDHERELKRGAKEKEIQAPFAGGDQPGKSVQGADKKKAEGSLREAAALLWGSYPGGGGECVTEHLGPGDHPSGSSQKVHGGSGGAVDSSPKSADADEDEEELEDFKALAEKKAMDLLEEREALRKERYEHGVRFAKIQEDRRAITKELGQANRKSNELSRKRDELTANIEKNAGKVSPEQLKSLEDIRQKLADEAVEASTKAFKLGKEYEKINKLENILAAAGVVLSEKRNRVEGEYQMWAFAASDSGQALGHLTENLVSDKGNFGLHEHFREQVVEAHSTGFPIAAELRGDKDVTISADGTVIAKGNSRANVKKYVRDEIAWGLQKAVDNKKLSRGELIETAAEMRSIERAKVALKGKPSSNPAYWKAGFVDDMKRLSTQEVAQEISQGTLDTWAASSTDDNPTSAAIQIAVKEKFGDTGPIRALSAAASKEGGKLYQDNRKVFDTTVNTIYENTQRQLKAKGVEKVTLFRGMKVPKESFSAGEQKMLKNEGTAPFDLSLDLNPISSFAMDYESAAVFAGSRSGTKLPSISMVEVPRERIFATAATGMGCLTESEILVTGEAPLKGKIIAVDSTVATVAEIPYTLNEFGTIVKRFAGK